MVTSSLLESLQVFAVIRGWIVLFPRHQLLKHLNLVEKINCRQYGSIWWRMKQLLRKWLDRDCWSGGTVHGVSSKDCSGGGGGTDLTCGQSMCNGNSHHPHTSSPAGSDWVHLGMTQVQWHWFLITITNTCSLQNKCLLQGLHSGLLYWQVSELITMLPWLPVMKSWHVSAYFGDGKQCRIKTDYRPLSYGS